MSAEALPAAITYDVVGRDRAIAVLRMRRPEQRNALTLADVAQLREYLWRAEADPAIRAVLCLGDDGSFCAGADLDEMNAIQAAGESVGAIFRTWAALLVQMMNCPLPILAAIDGPCAGGGIQLAICSDICVMSTRSYLLNSPGIKLGLPSSELGTLALPLTIGWKRAKAMSLLSATIPPDQALELGLCYAVHVPEELEASAIALAEQVARRDPDALAANKFALNQALAAMTGLLPLTTLGATVQVDRRGTSWPR